MRLLLLLTAGNLIPSMCLTIMAMAGKEAGLAHGKREAATSPTQRMAIKLVPNIES